MRIRYGATALGLGAVLIGGCGGSGSAPQAPVPETSSPAAALPQRDGLVGAIDSVRVVAVCGNVRLYATAVEGGLSASADEAFDAIVQALRQPPRDRALLALAAQWKLTRDRIGDGKTADRLLAFCARLGPEATTALGVGAQRPQEVDLAEVRP